MANVDIVAAGRLPEKTLVRLLECFASHRVTDVVAAKALSPDVAAKVRGIARGSYFPLDRGVLERFPNLEIVANFGVGYDGIDLEYTAAHGIVVTNTPDVLTEEVADTALGLLLMTVRELSAAERYLRSGHWKRAGAYRLSATLRDRTVGLVGLGRIGSAIARRLDAARVPVVYHTRRPRPDAKYTYYADLLKMAIDVDTLVVVVPGTPATVNLVGRDVLAALGPRGILINIGRGTVVDEAALIEALGERTLYGAGLDVFANEPDVPESLLALDNVVLLPHVGSASVHTRDAMGQLVANNLINWFEKGVALTPIPAT